MVPRIFFFLASIAYQTASNNYPVQVMSNPSEIAVKPRSNCAPVYLRQYQPHSLRSV